MSSASSSASFVSVSVPKSSPSSQIDDIKRRHAQEKLEKDFKRKKLDPAHFKLSEKTPDSIRCSACKTDLSIAGSNGFSNVYAHERRQAHQTAVLHVT